MFPNGLACAPRLFTKLLKPVYATLQSEGITCLGYIDDCLLIADTHVGCQRAIDRAIHLFTELGFLINYEKSVLVPQQRITFLGFQFDSSHMTLTLGDDKQNKMLDMCPQFMLNRTFTIREVAQLIGYMVAYCDGTEHGLLHYRHLEHDKKMALKRSMGHYDCSMYISPQGRLEIQWWISNVRYQARTLWKAAPCIVVYSDASMQGWGGVMGTSSARGQWTALEKEAHINVLELKAALFSLQTLCKDTHDIHIQLQIDNTTAVAYVNNMGGSKSMICNSVAFDIWSWAVHKHIWLLACHIAGKDNFYADAESRKICSEKEWKLSPHIFSKICRKWGTPDVDIFASRIAHQLDKYVSWKPDPGAYRIDAFSFVWNENVYAFPPFSVMDRCLQKMKQDDAHGVIIAPRWPTRPWWAMLMKMSKNVMTIPRASQHLKNPITGTPHPIGHLSLVACQI